MRRTDERNYQTTWEDLGPWIEQLYQEHRVTVEFMVKLQPTAYELKPAVVMIVTRHLKGQPAIAAQLDWRIINPRCVGMVEREALQMASKLLLDLENEKAAAEQQQTLFLWQ